MGIKLSNNANATLAASITSSSTSITVTTGQGARFPTLSAGDYFYATLVDTSNNLEIVKCTARSTDVLTVVRAQESTTARAYTTGDRIEIRLTAQTFLDATTFNPTPAEVSDEANTSTGYFDLPAGTTAQRPGTPNSGNIRYNTTLEALEMHDGTNWIIVKTSFAATGGTVTDVAGYRVHTFTSSGTFTVSKGSTDVEYLVIAGGGGGDSNRGAGGGGAGGYRCSVTGESSGGGAAAETKLNVTTGSYTVTIGAGGVGRPYNGSPDSANGSNSVFGSITSIGGGWGNSNNRASPYNGNSGGSGGGAGAAAGGGGSGGAGTTGQGYAGGNTSGTATATDVEAGAGGGGAGAVGGSTSSSTAANGGAGVSSSITGTAVTRGGGGGGGKNGSSSGAGAGGAGGGGAGCAGSGTQSGLFATAGTANTGGGGGAGGANAANGANGGSGIVIIRYPI